ncbi:MAG: class I SAM-dependent methyltransferase [Myxococcales bacterium]|nr:class I SAM-dependent methyltransferase [Myxococcales bacterium]
MNTESPVHDNAPGGLSPTAGGDHAAEVREGKRFRFGRNWSQFLGRLNDARIAEAERSLREYLGVDDLEGRTFLDVGSGSGLFSLAARRLGARVRSFDFDPDSVACAGELRRRYFPDDPNWIVQEGSALDTRFLKTLGRFDVVYSWGVLHHTGAMWDALANVAPLVDEGGMLFVAIYNDCGWTSRAWTAIKRLYNRTPPPLRFLILVPSFIRFWGPKIAWDLLRGRPFQSWRAYAERRGMSPWYDVVDWVGGYPYEVATPDEIVAFYHDRGFQLRKLATRRGHACNQFVFDLSHPGERARLGVGRAEGAKE